MVGLLFRATQETKWREKHVGFSQDAGNQKNVLDRICDMANMLNIRKEVNGWVVRLVRDGVEYSKYFRFSDGGVRKSLVSAKEWRDALSKKLGPRRWRTGPNRSKPTNNTSGTVGVSKNVYNRWVASWNEDGKQRFKTFRTKKEAVAHRKEQVERLSK